MERSSCRRRTASRRPFTWLLLLVLPSLAGSARALGIADIEPFYFEGAGGLGFSESAVAAAGRSADYSASSADLQLTAGGGTSVQIGIVNALGTVHQDPVSPSTSNPLIADSTWTLRNNTSTTLLAPLLVFTRVDPNAIYPIALPKTGLDADLLVLLRYSFGNESRLLGATLLPTLRPGETTAVTVRYVVAGALAPGNPAKLPPLGVTVLASYAVIPEPASAALVGVGLALLAARARRRNG
jgi:hypothetical protein